LAWWGVLSLVVMVVPAGAQTQPLPATGPAGSAVGSDQAAQPQLPRLVLRGPQPATQEPRPQPPPAPPFTLTPQEEAQLDRVLNQWEERNRDIKTFDCRFRRWIYDVVFGPPDQAKFIDLGVIKYAKPDRGLFRIDTTEKDGKEVSIDNARAEHWLSDGKSIFIYSPGKKQLIEQQLPPELQGKAIADGPLPFVFGAEAKKLKERYWIRLLPPDKNQQDQILLEAFPRHQQDAANFHHAQFIITAEKMEPYALNLVQPNGKDHMAYVFFDVVVNDPLRLFKGDPFRAFTPLGWQKIVRPAAPAAPTAQALRPAREDRR
jgi:TIGR03009 family protein